MQIEKTYHGFILDFVFFEILKIGKVIINILLPKVFHYFEFSQKTMYVKEHMAMNMLTKFRVDILKIVWVLSLLTSRRPLFMLFQGLLTSFDLYIVPIWALESVADHDSRLRWKFELKACIAPPKSKIYTLIFLTSWLWMAWHRSPKVHGLLSVSQADPCRFFSFVSSWSGDISRPSERW